MSTITIIGTGYVGLVTGVALAQKGNRVVCIGRNTKKIDDIKRGIAPFFEPGLDTLLGRLVKNGSLSASGDLEKHVFASDCTLLCVGTPTVGNAIDLSEMKDACKLVGTALGRRRRYHVVCVKSTVVPGTTESVVKKALEQYSGKKAGTDFGLCMNPEFLREGKALEDAMSPDRIVIGAYDGKSAKVMKNIYARFSCAKMMTSIRTAEMIKYASNAFFATLISYANEIGRIAEHVGNVDVVDVWKGVHLDKRLSPIISGKRIHPGFLSYLVSGCGYGGSCFPKDTKALVHVSKQHGYTPTLIQSVIAINKTQPYRLVSLLEKELGNLKGKRIAVWGLAFKPDTDDIRESASLSVISQLHEKGAVIICHDPMLSRMKEKITILPVQTTESLSESIHRVDGVIVVTSWEEYKKCSPSFFIAAMKQPVVIDARRIYDREAFLNAGVRYNGIGWSTI